MDDRARAVSALLDWENELKYNEAMLKDDSVSETQKEYARARVEEAKGWIKKIQQELK